MSRATEATLTRVCQEARDLPIPELDAAALEAKVLERVRHSSVDSVVVPSRRGWLARHQVYAWSAAMAAAAALALLRQTPESAPNPVVSRGRGLLIHEPATDGAALPQGQALEATEHDLTVHHRGIVTWRLAASGRARIVEQGQRITVALDQGRIEAEVVPQARPEVFAVEIEHVRVAVHGTVFSVERHGDAAEVVVSEGEVRLGTSDQRGNTRGEILAAPVRKSLEIHAQASGSAEPRPSAAAAKARGRSPAKSEHPAAHALHQGSEAKSSADPNLPEAPAPADIERLWEVINREVSLCFAEQPGDPNVRVSFSTRIGVLIAADGTVSLTSFEPPLAEPVYRCITQQTAELRTAATRQGTFVRREKMLMR